VGARWRRSSAVAVRSSHLWQPVGCAGRVHGEAGARWITRVELVLLDRTCLRPMLVVTSARDADVAEAFRYGFAARPALSAFKHGHDPLAHPLAQRVHASKGSRAPLPSDRVSPRVIGHPSRVRTRRRSTHGVRDPPRAPA
jgi:hypothetical protein